MIDHFALALSHGLMLLAAWRLMARPDLDDDDAVLAGPDTDFLGRPRQSDTSDADTAEEDTGA